MAGVHAASRWARLRDLIGADAAAALVAQRGGHQVVVPTTVRAECLLTQLAGEIAMRRVVFELSGAVVYVPLRSRNADRDRRIREEAAGGQSAAELSHRYGLSVRQLRNILRG